MIKQKMYQVDAFTDVLFGGNPAAVCVLDDWFEEKVMQKIAAENNLSETSFVVKKDDHYEIRWFTPVAEVALCGHATLASAHVLFEYYNHPTNTIYLDSKYSGELSVTKNRDLLTLDFPKDVFNEINPPESIVKAFDKAPTNVYKGKTDYMLLYEDQKDIEQSTPNFHLLKESKARGIIITSKGKNVDFVSRFFAPGCGVDEDPVTGSAHTTLTPFWSERLGKQKLSAEQISSRGGKLICELQEDRVRISGKAVTYLIGEIFL
jgi:PhzF family phenazine biosynthesis protein